MINYFWDLSASEISFFHRKVTGALKTGRWNGTPKARLNQRKQILLVFGCEKIIVNWLYYDLRTGHRSLQREMCIPARTTFSDQGIETDYEGLNCRSLFCTPILISTFSMPLAMQRWISNFPIPDQ
jgi:hypothetical protein